MLIVEDGTGLPDANSYAGLEFAARYFGLRGNDTWFGGEPTAAEGTLTLSALPNAGDTVTLGQITYKFVTALSDPAVANEVMIGSDVTDSRDHLIAAINQAGGRGTTYSGLTVRNYWAQATTGSAQAVDVIAVAPGPVGNEVVTTATGVPTWGAATLENGSQIIDEAQQAQALIDATTYIEARFSNRFAGRPLTATQALSFPRTGINTSCSRGHTMPPGLMTATVEYAVRALVSPLAPDPVTDPSGYALTRRRRKLGPIENEWEYAAGAGNQVGPSLWQPYPIPDSMLSCMIQGGLWASQRRVIRS